MNKRFAILRGYGRKIVAGFSGLALTGLALAQTAADPFDTAMTAATTKTSAYAASLVGLAAVSVVFMIGVKYVKKIRSAA